MSNLVLFGLNSPEQYAKSVAWHLDMILSDNTCSNFIDGETYVKSNVNVRGCDVYVISGLYTDEKFSINDRLISLLWFIGSLKDASAKRITTIVPYLGYSKQDRKTESRAPITTKYLAMVFESVGLDRLLTIDVHNLAAFQNAFRIPADNLDVTKLYSEYLYSGDNEISKVILDNPEDLVILSPDIGGMSRCSKFQSYLSQKLKTDISLAIFDKRRIKIDNSTQSVLEGENIIGNVAGKKVIIYDDMISTGGTISKAVESVVKNNGEILAVCASHGVFVGDYEEKLKNVPNIIVTDSLPTENLSATFRSKLLVVNTSRLVAQCVKRTHEEGGSISDLLKG